MIQIFGILKNFDVNIAYLDESEMAEKLFENQLKLLKQPVCRNGKNSAAVGFAKETWEGWK